MKFLLYHQHLMQSGNLIEGRLLLLDPETPFISDTFIATSGQAFNQTYDSLSARGRGPIPQNSVIRADHYTVDTTPIYMPQVKGVEGNFYKINPHTVTVNGIERGDFGIHFDANVPRSSGCVVLRTQIGWQVFKKHMLDLVNNGINKIALLVSYSR